MATIRTVIVPTKALRDGRHKVRISIAHNGQTRYIPTSVILDNVREWKNGIVVNRGDASYLNTKLRKILQQYQNAIDELGYIDGLSCSELVNCISNSEHNKHKTVKEVFDKYIELSNITEGSKNNYRSHYRCLTSFIDEGTLIERISLITVAGYNKFMIERGYKANSRRDKLMFISLLINFAGRCRYAVPQVNPIIGYDVPQPEVRQSWLSVSDIKKIRDAECTTQGMRICRDVFMLSYYLGGINIVDLLAVNFDECKNNIKYVRAKTKNKPKLNKYVEFTIPSEAKQIISRYKTGNGHLFFGEFNNKNRMHNLFGKNLKKIAAAAGIDKLIYYSARKSFAQHAFQIGVSESVIDYILGHRVDKSSTSLYSYISVTPKQATDAVRLVLDNLK